MHEGQEEAHCDISNFKKIHFHLQQQTLQQKTADCHFKHFHWEMYTLRRLFYQPAEFIS